jgi:uncharacterized protein YjbJ (UPF0337 family)
VKTAFHGLREANNDEIIDKAKGKIMQAVGDLSGNKGVKREREGQRRQGKGEVKDANCTVKGRIRN